MKRIPIFAKDEAGNELPDNLCNRCGISLNAGTPVDKEVTTQRRPRPGDICICYRCGNVMRMSNLMLLQDADQAFLDSLDPEDQAKLKEAQDAVKAGWEPPEPTYE